MIHFGDITKISGFDVPAVDVIVGGSPCQDLSIAGKRAGLDGERSGLFMEQLRIIKEMRENDRRNGQPVDDVRPRYMVWENVPGAFSSHGGEDFRIVLEETAKVADKEASIPMPDKGKWATSGCVMGDGWSIAWRVLDAQFWGTSSKPLPQRRRRIALVADFGGQSASEILFVRKSVSGNTEPSEPKGKKTPCDATRGIGADDREGEAYTLKIRSGCEGGGKGALIQTEKSATLSTLQDQTLFQPVYSDVRTTELVVSKIEPAVCYSIGAYHSKAWESDNPNSGIYEADKSRTLDALNCGYPACNQGGIAVVEKKECYAIGNGQVDGTGLHEKVESLNCMHDQQAVLISSTAYCIGNGQANDAVQTEKELCKTLNCMVDPMKVCVAVDARNGTENETNGALQSNSAHSLNGNNVVRVRYIVRRLTPMECERLQGFPDGWTNIGEYTDTNGKKKKSSDSARYKALGNSIAIPPWKWVMKRISACYERDATLASLFDGIGGFPYIWEQINGKGSCLWASEIEEFCIAVTKARIG